MLSLEVVLDIAVVSVPPPRERRRPPRRERRDRRFAPVGAPAGESDWDAVEFGSGVPPFDESVVLRSGVEPDCVRSAPPAPPAPPAAPVPTAAPAAPVPTAPSAARVPPALPVLTTPPASTVAATVPAATVAPVALAVAERLRRRRRERERREGLGVSVGWVGGGVGSAGSRPSLARMLRTTRPGLRPSVRTRTLDTSRYRGRRSRMSLRYVAPGSSPASRGRLELAPVRRSPSAILISRYTTVRSRSNSRVASDSTAPPPSDTTPLCSSTARRTTRSSMRRNSGSPSAAKISGMVRPVSSSIPASVSYSSTPSSRASLRPIVDFPAPGGPISTTHGWRGSVCTITRGRRPGHAGAR